MCGRGEFAGYKAEQLNSLQQSPGGEKSSSWASSLCISHLKAASLSPPSSCSSPHLADYLLYRYIENNLISKYIVLFIRVIHGNLYSLVITTLKYLITENWKRLFDCSCSFLILCVILHFVFYLASSFCLLNSHLKIISDQ